ncbi:tripartite motif-containing protein 46-like [Carcharodon carcharias]|uniref:tripartite motif-containing protein 46-like n=1 Tax=Carcharodon carcharias TaxID=13397 RepID=UPI001B7DEA30|nr:tripartite motif-containing protein 46-like [Carcharodon carcharias]
MKNIERELICPLCKEMYKQPIILPCMHNVCLMCATELLVQQGILCTEPISEPSSPASTPMMRSPRLGRRTAPKADRLDRLIRSGYGTYPGRRRGNAHPQSVSVPCPSCQREVDLGERGLTDLFRNLTLERIVERYKHTANLGAAVQCQLCKPPTQEATKGCTDCRANYCNECFKLHHPWGTPKAQHEYIGPTLSFRPKVLMCPEHELEKVNLYCKTCQRLICQLCKLRRVHTAHKITPAGNIYQALKDKLSKTITYIISNQNLVQTQIQTLDELVQQTERNSSKAQEEVVKLIQELCCLLEDKQTTLLQAIEECKQQRLQSLSAQISEHQGMLEHSGMVSYTQEVLKETDHPCFVQAAKQLYSRIVKATESLQNFSPAADPSFDHFQLDITSELKLLNNLQFATAPDAPVIDTQRTYAYDQIYLCWRLPKDSAAAWHYEVEFRQADHSAKGPRRWQRIEEVRGTGTAVGHLDMDRVYALRVRGYNKAGYGEYSEEIYLRSPPAPVLHFLLDNKWGFCRDRLIVSKDQRAVRSVAGIPMLFAAEPIMTSCHLSIDLVIGDVALTQGKHYWACSVDPSSYLVKVGIGLESKLLEWFQVPQDVVSPRYDPDSGHDSGAEDATVDAAPPYAFLTIGMGKVLLPQGSPLPVRDPAGGTAPLPSRLGVCLDYERGRVAFYDAVSFRSLWECGVDCSGPVCPAFCFVGGGALHLQELVATRPEQKAVNCATHKAMMGWAPFGGWNPGSLMAASIYQRPDSGTPI